MGEPYIILDLEGVDYNVDAYTIVDNSRLRGFRELR
jgi:hypothetical protein